MTLIRGSCCYRVLHIHVLIWFKQVQTTRIPTARWKHGHSEIQIRNVNRDIKSSDDRSRARREEIRRSPHVDDFVWKDEPLAIDHRERNFRL